MASFTFAELEGLWIAAGGSPTDAPTAAAIALAESGGCQYTLAGPVDVRPVPECAYRFTTGENSFGLWQINVAAHTSYQGSALWDPAANAQAAVSIERARGNFTDWSTFTTTDPTRSYRAFLPAVPPAPQATPPPPSPNLDANLKARPPKLNAWSASLVIDSPDVFAFKPDVPTSWQYWCGALGYWLPNALNRSAETRRYIRSLR